MRYQGRNIDPVALWAEFVEFPQNLRVEEESEFLPLVQCPNPDHHTEKRHFQINLDKPLVHCFAGCGISGTYEHALSMITGETQRASRKRILRHSRVGGPVKKKRRGTPGSAIPISSESLLYERYVPQFGMEYLAARGISPASIAKWELGWDDEDRRIVIPVHDSRGRVRLLIKRAVREKDHPKYLYTEGVERNALLYGVCQIDLGLVQSEGIILVEGSIDTILQHQHGFRNTVGILGSKLSEIQAKQIANMRPRRVISMFDADGAGISATISAAARLRRVPFYVVRYPKGITDPGTKDFNIRQRERAIGRAISISEFRAKVRHLTRSKPKEEIEVG